MSSRQDARHADPSPQDKTTHLPQWSSVRRVQKVDIRKETCETGHVDGSLSSNSFCCSLVVIPLSSVRDTDVPDIRVILWIPDELHQDFSYRSNVHIHFGRPLSKSNQSYRNCLNKTFVFFWSSFWNRFVWYQLSWLRHGLTFSRWYSTPSRFPDSWTRRIIHHHYRIVLDHIIRLLDMRSDNRPFLNIG